MKKKSTRRVFETGVSEKSVEGKHGSQLKAALAEAVYQTLAEQVHVGLYVLQKGRFCYVNRFFCTVLEYDEPEALIGRSLWGMVHPDDRKLVRLGTVPEGDGEFLLTPPFRMIARDGRAVWVHMRGEATTYQGRAAHMGYLINVTSLRNRIGALEESLQRYETILDDVDVQLGEMDLEGNVTFVNDAGCRMWGLPREELIGLNYRSYMDQETAQRFYEIYKDVFTTGIPVKNAMLTLRDKEGRRRAIEKSVSLIRDGEGIISGFRMVTRDITDRMEAEKRLTEHRSRLEAIFASVRDAIITVDPELLVMEANKSTETICGMAVKEITGRQFSRCHPPCSHACLGVLRRTLEEKGAIRDHRIECDHQDRPYQVVSVSSSPLLDAQGTFMGAVLVIRDVTLLRDLERELRERNRFQNIIGRNKTMQDIYRLLEDLANVDTTVLVTGESGTGKELVARALHYSGKRSFRPFVTVNCSALAETLLESELFGHVKGAFTGAIKDKPGRFQAADGGTIFLDEIGDISPVIQMKLLRVLQEKEFERVGESVSRRVDVRVIACTNKNLKDKVRQGEFREDLYYRLKVVEVALPPLRERLEDLPLLVDHFRCFFNERFGKDVEGISDEVLRSFMEYPWPGNVRELEHVMEHAFVLCRGGAITLEHLPADIGHYERSRDVSPPRTRIQTSRSAQEILDALNRTDWNKAKAARLLGIGRRTIYRKIESYRLSKE